MNPLAHRIRRQRWRVSGASQREAFAIRARLREEWETVLPVLDRAFTEIAPGEEIVHIPRLELRLRIAGADLFTEVLRDTIGRQLHEQLRSVKRRVPPRGGFPGGRTDHALRETHPEGARRPVQAESGSPPRRITVEESRFDALVRYLERGDLPWTLMQSERDGIVAVLKETAGRRLAVVLERARAEERPARAAWVFFFRLLQLLPEERWPAIAELAAAALPAGVRAELIAAVVSLSAPALGISGRHARGQWVAAAIALAYARPGPGGTDDLGSTVSAALGDDPADAIELPAAAAAFFRRRLGHAGKPPARTAAYAPRRARGAPGLRARTDEELLRKLPPVPGPARSVEPAETGEDAADGFALSLHHAGLVLLHPFLPRLFGSAGIIPAASPGPLPARALPRCAALLHHAATGGEEIHEFELGFIKILLGLPPDRPLPVCEGLLVQSDREEIAALLQAAIGHWPALKSTSVQGLRVSFLRRPGLMRKEPEGWHLQVERESFDVLLDLLPWGFGTVKLPWMPQPLFTDWPTR